MCPAVRRVDDLLFSFVDVRRARPGGSSQAVHRPHSANSGWSAVNLETSIPPASKPTNTGCAAGSVLREDVLDRAAITPWPSIQTSKCRSGSLVYLGKRFRQGAKDLREMINKAEMTF